MKTFRHWLALLGFLLVFTPALAVDFEDVKERQGKVYGSEKDKRYVIDAFFVEWESWPRKNPTHSSFHMFWLFNSTDYPKYERSQFFPFYSTESSKVDARYEANHLLFSQYSQSTKDSYSYRLFPFLWVANQKNTSSYNAFFPLYYSGETNTADKKESLLVFPGFYHVKSQLPKFGIEKVTSVSPFHVYNVSRSDKGENSSFWFPILPIYYASKDEKSIHRNYLWIIDTDSDAKTDTLSRVWILPVLYWKRDSYMNVFPIYFKENSDDAKTGSWYGIFPPSYYSYAPNSSTFYLLNFYANSKTHKEYSESFTTFAPLYFNWNNSKGYSETLVPALWYSETKEDSSTHKNILVLYDDAFDKKGNLERLSVIPLFFYKRNSYLHILPPLYWSWKSDTTSHTLAFPFFYREKNGDSSNYTNVIGLGSREYDEKGKLVGSMIAPFYFYKRDSHDIVFPFSFKFGPDEEAKDLGTRWGLLYYNHWNPKDETLWIANWFSYKDKENGTHFKSLNPIYYNWKTKESSGEISPLFVTINFPNKDKFHINLTGYSSSVNSGLLKPDVSMGVGEKSGYKYIDTDVSWLWYAFRLSTRTSNKIFYDLEKTAKNFVQDKQEVTALNSDTTAESPKISKKKSFTREDSIDFFGVNVLFGLYGWEAGDSKRHIRAFPLAWFTWDKNSDDKVYTIPPLFVNYFSEDVRYTVVFPFYGYQKTPEAERTAFGFIGYLSESIKENRVEEKSVLWPLANWHSSDVKFGSRILPFYWYRNRNEGRDKISTLVTPLFFYNNTLDRKGTEEAYTLSPLWFRFYNREAGESVDRHFTLPLYYFSQNNSKYEKSNLFVSAPFIYYGIADTHGKTVYNRIFWTVPLLALYNSDNFGTNWNALVLVNSIESKENSNFLFFPVYYHDIDYNKGKTTSLTRWVFPGYYNKNYASKITDTEKVTFYSPLVFYHSYENKSIVRDDKYWFSPLALSYHSYESIDHSSYWNWMLFASYENSDTAHNIKVFPIFYQDFYEQDSKNYNYTNWFIPFYYWNKNKDTKVVKYSEEDSKEVSNSETTIFSIFGYYNNRNENKLLFLTPFVFYYSESAVKTYYNWLALVSREKTKTNSSFQFLPIFSWHSYENKNDKQKEDTYWLAPFYYYSKSKISKSFADSSGEKKEISESDILVVTPIGFYNNQNDSTKKWFFAGLYHSSSEMESYFNFLLLLNSEDSKERKSLAMLPFFGNSTSYTKDGNRNQSSYWSAVLPFWFNKEYPTKDSSGETTFLSLLVYQNSKYKTETGENFYSNTWIIPIAFNYNINKEETNWQWMFISNYKGTKDRISMALIPLTGFDFDERDKDLDHSSFWLMPFVYYKKEENRKLNQFDKTVVSLFYNHYETEVKSEKLKSYEKTVLFPIIPIVYYKNSTLESEHSNILMIADYTYKNDKLTRFTLFPYWYSVNTDKPDNPKKYRHIFPVYFSSESNTEYSSFIAGAYWSSDSKVSMQNLFMIGEHQYFKEAKRREVDILLRSVHIASGKEEFNFRFLYGLFNYKSIAQKLDMNLLWLTYQNQKDYSFNNILPMYYLENTKAEKKLWVTPALFYSQINEKENFRYAGLGALYYSNSDHEKKEDHMNLLMGILYYKTSILKERGYEGEGSLWGLLWEHKKESETKYSKFSVLKFVYSSTTDETGDTYRRIMGVRL